MADFKDSLIFPAGERFDNENFSGEVWLKMLTGMPCPVANVTFAPACRNNWHTHRGGQILLVTAGRGYYQFCSSPRGADIIRSGARMLASCARATWSKSPPRSSTGTARPWIRGSRT